jgi:hypothetical protein
MHRALRTTLAVLGGTVVSMLAVTLGDTLLRQVWTLPSGYGDGGVEALNAALRTVPAAAFATAVTSWALASAAGSAVATRLSAGRKPWAGWIVACVLTAASLANLAMVWHPVWMWPAVVVMVPGAGWLAARAAAGRGEAASDVAPDPHVHA